MASRGINKVILVGNLGSDPENRMSQAGAAITNLSIAPQRPGRTRIRASSRSAPNGTVSYFSTVWLRLRQSTCVRARRYTSRALCGPENGKTNKLAKIVTPLRLWVTKCRCSIVGALAVVVAIATTTKVAITTAIKVVVFSLRQRLRPLPLGALSTQWMTTSLFKPRALKGLRRRAYTSFRIRHRDWALATSFYTAIAAA